MHVLWDQYILNFSIDVKNDLYICTFLIKSWPVCNSISRPSAFMPSTIVMNPLFKSLIKPNFKTRLFFISGLFFHFWWFFKVQNAEKKLLSIHFSNWYNIIAKARFCRIGPSLFYNKFMKAFLSSIITKAIFGQKEIQKIAQNMLRWIAD